MTAAAGTAVGSADDRLRDGRQLHAEVMGFVKGSGELRPLIH
jgi:hypothetical protein